MMRGHPTDESTQPALPGGAACASVRVVIADDEPLAREALREALATHPEVELVGEAIDGPSALREVARAQPDVVFLDLRMPGLGGLEVARMLADAAPATAPAVVFVTAYDQHAIDAFDLHAADYVLKPFEPSRVRIALERARVRVGTAALQRAMTLVPSLVAQQPCDGDAGPVRSSCIERFAVTSIGRVRIVPVSEVEWLQADDNYVRLHTISGSGGLIRDSLRALESALDPAHFVRVHRSATIRLDRLRELRVLPGGEYEAVLVSGARVSVGRAYREQIMKRLR